MASRAQLSQARSRARRDELLVAAIDLFAARAGLPPATTTYYFASIEELVREALSTHIASWVATLEALADVEVDARLDLDTASDFVTGIFATRSPEKAGTELAIYLAAARDPELRPTAAEALRALEDLAVRFFERLGIGTARDVAAQAVALIAGVALRRQSGQYDDVEEARLLTSAIGHLVAAHLAPADGASARATT